MGQKVNPTCLRLHPKNKHFDSCWFSEKRYAYSIYKDLDIEIYYNAILKQIQYPSALSFLEASPRKHQIFFLFLNPAQLREQSFKQLNNTSGRNRKRKQNALFDTRKETTSQYGLLEKREKFFGLLSPYFFTAAFLQNLKKKGGVFSLKKRNPREESEGFKRIDNLLSSSFLQVEKRDSQWCLSLSDRVKKETIITPPSYGWSSSPTRLETVSAHDSRSIPQKTLHLPLNLKGESIKRTPQSLFPTNKNKHITQLFTQFVSFSDRKTRMPLLLDETGNRFDPFLAQYIGQKNVEVEHAGSLGDVGLFSLKKENKVEKNGLGVSYNIKNKSFFEEKRKKKQAESEKAPRKPSEKTRARPSLHANDGGCLLSETRGMRHLQLKRGVCSSMLGLAISQYFVQRNLSGNFLSATSRFLLLQVLSSFLKKKENSPQIFGGFPQKEKEFVSGVGLFRSFFKERLWLRHHSESSKFANQISRQESDLFFKLQKSSIYTSHIESIICNRLKSSCKISLFRAQNVAQNALFLAEEIVYQLQRRNTFRQIKIRFLQELANKPTIKGVRVTCVGRIGGRAKKAQRARGESFKMGQTSLHLFDSKVSFASKTALTPYGAVGVKVWVCWK